MSDEELRDTASTIWSALDAGDDVAIVAGGEPRAILLPITGGDVADAVRFGHRVQAQ